jgi:hypothetical protein
MITARDFPYCCTARIICDFGESTISEGDHNKPNENTMLNAVILKILYGISTQAVFTAITNSEQKVAIRVLKALKFKSTRWMAKGQHPETHIKLWWFPVEAVEKCIPKWLELDGISNTTQAELTRQLKRLENNSKWGIYDSRKK